MEAMRLLAVIEAEPPKALTTKPAMSTGGEAAKKMSMYPKTQNSMLIWVIDLSLVVASSFIMAERNSDTVGRTTKRSIRLTVPRRDMRYDA